MMMMMTRMRLMYTICKTNTIILYMCDGLHEVNAVDVVVEIFDVIGRGIETRFSRFIKSVTDVHPVYVVFFRFKRFVAIAVAAI